MRIVNVIIRRLTEYGYQVSVGSSVTIFEAQVRFGIKECLRQVKEKSPYPSDKGAMRTRYVPTGQLELFIKNDWISGAVCRKRWRDEDANPIEFHLRSFIESLFKVAVRVRAYNIEKQRQDDIRAAKERERELEAQRRAVLRKARLEENERRQILAKRAQAWHRSNLLREFVSAVEAADPAIR
jgi:hypothetical protein